MFKILSTIALIVLIALAVFYLLPDNSLDNSEKTNNNNIPTNNENTNEETNQEPANEQPTPNQKTKTFILTGENFKFIMNGQTNPEIIVNQGDKVRIEFTSTSGFHDWVVDEFNAATNKVRDTDGTTTVEFTADKTGTFEYYCSVGSHRQQGMKGKLIVE